MSIPDARRTPSKSETAIPVYLADQAWQASSTSKKLQICDARTTQGRNVDSDEREQFGRSDRMLPLVTISITKRSLVNCVTMLIPFTAADAWSFDGPKITSVVEHYAVLPIRAGSEG